MMQEKLLQVNNVSVHYNGVRALKEVSIDIYSGEIVALMGPNGAGKSTLLKSIFGLVKIDSGEIVWRGNPVTPVTHEIAKLGIAFIPQGRRVFRHLTVEENLEMGGFMINDKKLLRQRMEEAMDFFPVLREKRKSKSGTLSGGQQQQLAMARGLVTDPQVLLLDEPSLGLSPKLVKEVFEKIMEINRRRKMTIVVVEHNIKSLLNIANRAYVLDKGKIVVEGQSNAFRDGDILQKVFLGEDRKSMETYETLEKNT
jgi:branched-chain amino acid transport system ATP-binding protein